MNHNDHVYLLKNAINKNGGLWADFGSGEGAFTLALRDLAGETVKIYSIDKSKSALQIQKEKFEAKFPNTNIEYIHEDFTIELKLPKLDGIIMANSLHFLKEKLPFLKKIKEYIKENGKLIIVEYNIDIGNIWVPYPASFESFKKLAVKAGFSKVSFLANRPSDFLNEIYSAEAIN